MNGVFSACISILSQLSVLISGSAKIKDKDFQGNVDLFIFLIFFAYILCGIQSLGALYLYCLTEYERKGEILEIDNKMFERLKLQIYICDFAIQLLLVIIQIIISLNINFTSWITFGLSSVTTTLSYAISLIVLMQVIDL